MTRQTRCWIAAGALALAALPAGAATLVFDFAWTGDPAQDAGPEFSADAAAFAVGVFAVLAGPGDVVGPAEVVALELTFGSSVFDPVTLAGPAGLEFFAFDGTVTADGTAIVMRDLFLSVRDGDGRVESFGCIMDTGDCRGDNLFGDNILMASGPFQLSFFYPSAEVAQASLRMTAREPLAPIPLPATLPLLLGGLGLLAVARRRAA